MTRPTAAVLALSAACLVGCGSGGPTTTPHTRLVEYARTIPDGPAGPVNAADYVTLIEDVCDSPTVEVRSFLALSSPRAQAITRRALEIRCPHQLAAAT